MIDDKLVMDSINRAKSADGWFEDASSLSPCACHRVNQEKYL
jgi:hypothetical protein